jgi:HK97 family phage major capsid protein
MFKLFKLLKSLKAKGYATKEEKEKVALMLKELDSEEQEEVKEEVEEANKLPEQKPETSNTPSEEEEQAELEKNIKALVSGSVKVAVKEATDTIKSQVKEWLESQKEALSKKAGIYHPQVQETRKRMNTYLRDFSSALYNGDVEGVRKVSGGISTKELTTDATGSPYGGYVVDSELSAEIRHLITEYGIARREFSAVQLSKNSYRANSLVTDVSVYWVDEGSAIGSTQVVLDQETLELKKLGAIVTLTRELIEDQEIDLFAFIAGRVAEGFARAEDLAFFVGDGTSTYGGFTGILNNANVNEVVMAGSTFASMDADDLLDMQDETPQGALANGKYYMHRSIRSIVRKLKDTQGQYIYQAPTADAPGMIWGKPVVEVEVLPTSADSDVDTPFVIFGDLKKSSILGYRGAIAADRFNAGVVRNVANNGDINLITTDREAIRWVERVGAITILPTAVTVLKTGAGS